MSYHGPERRRIGAEEGYAGPERRYVRVMTEEELSNEVHDLIDRVQALEENADRVAQLPDAVAQLTGAVQTLTSMVQGRFDGVDAHVREATGLKTAIQFASVVIIPIIIALIGGYFALRAGTSVAK